MSQLQSYSEECNAKLFRCNSKNRVTEYCYVQAYRFPPGMTWSSYQRQNDAPAKILTQLAMQSL